MSHDCGRSCLILSLCIAAMASRKRRIPPQLQGASADDSVAGPSSSSSGYSKDAKPSRVIPPKLLCVDSEPGVGRRRVPVGLRGVDDYAETSNRYEDEQLYRVNVVPASPPAVQYATPELETVNDALAPCSPPVAAVPIDVDSAPFSPLSLDEDEFPTGAYCRDMLGAQVHFGFSGRCLDFLLKLNAKYFPEHGPPRSRHLLMKELGDEGYIVKTLLYVCDECMHPIHEQSKICLNRENCGRYEQEEHAFNTGYARLDVKMQVVKIVKGSFSSYVYGKD